MRNPFKTVLAVSKPVPKVWRFSDLALGTMFVIGNLMYMRIRHIPSITADGGGSMNTVLVGSATPGVPLSVDVKVGGLVHCPLECEVVPVAHMEVTLA